MNKNRNQNTIQIKIVDMTTSKSIHTRTTIGVPTRGTR